uniref:Uncharacterized protein n=2 Tax=Leptocylindrus danicus TaxID=163516 RepID=A0A7S2PSA1_9STRA|mmetsp:Transcript_9214/g.13843  ORF Transcript_9214/g.13843 Transcript_9214/m.13843 type:complete len:236 (+) Transcript_9214:128-835(+)|eukprot:CAMPEP_0116037590 /NCGR_PEP_ID=MMETSP0321-20121206/22168_1 /TAXON_ID=163516 /ORGANISM="Leptocylindrus danicus var. danicus, Strain B650" /LENGTH=235 /DNA_ID=CAMNT_0003515871 /DNA_START=121 /DNA_END=828 /DNA_ORIENTATION=-
MISHINSILNISLTDGPEEMDEFDLSLLSAEDRTLYERCVLHQVEYAAALDPRTESAQERTDRHNLIKNRLKKKLGAERQRKRRGQLTPEARKQQRMRDAERQRQRRAHMTDDERRDQRNRDAERQRQRRAQLSVNEREEQRKRDKERQRKRRSRLASAAAATSNSLGGALLPKIEPEEVAVLPLGAATLPGGTVVKVDADEIADVVNAAVVDAAVHHAVDIGADPHVTEDISEV